MPMHRALRCAAVAALAASTAFPAAANKKLDQCLKLAALQGVPLGDCLAGSVQGGNLPSSGAPQGAMGYGAAMPPSGGAQMMCDVSAEPKRYGDWSLSACPIANAAGLLPGAQCVCKSAATGLVYGGKVAAQPGAYPQQQPAAGAR
jgi:hypothetical protein